ncbi:hypothetical protein [Acetobacter senegalensis]|uniref:hypothetical protein n=1 Tax=Acetobacter senegalensis TaxID=446692 RepID=UPI00073F2D7E|nr:hypothetical protein [Acetobacter senegalensis]
MTACPRYEALKRKRGLISFIERDCGMTRGALTKKKTITNAQIEIVCQSVARFCLQYWKMTGRVVYKMSDGPWSTQEIVFARALRKYAAPYSHIGFLLGRNKHSVRHWIKREVTPVRVRATAAWPGATIDKEIKRIQSEPLAPWADIVRLDAAIWLAKYGASSHKSAMQRRVSA